MEAHRRSQKYRHDQATQAVTSLAVKVQSHPGCQVRSRLRLTAQVVKRCQMSNTPPNLKRPKLTNKFKPWSATTTVAPLGALEPHNHTPKGSTMFKSHLLLIATTFLIGTAACSTEVEVEATADGLSAKDVANFSTKDCKKEKDGALAKIAKKSKRAIEDALKEIAKMTPIQWADLESKGVDIRKKNSCFVVTNSKSKKPSIISVHTDGGAASGGCSTVADVLKGARCDRSDLHIYEVSEKLCDKDHIYAAGIDDSRDWVYDEYNSSLWASQSKLLISECGKVSKAFEDSDD
jgi:hypothetical protein